MCEDAIKCVGDYDKALVGTFINESCSDFLSKEPRTVVVCAVGSQMCSWIKMPKFIEWAAIKFL